jgi:hypothetical protein
MTVESKLRVRIERDVPIKLYPFTRYFRGFERLAPVRELFGERAPEVLRSLKVEFFSARFGYMGTSDIDGHLIISSRYLKTGAFRDVYLDVVHELCHVNQFRHHKPLFYPKLSYVDAPSEIEAYRFTVKEGRRIGMTEKELMDYLMVQWISPEEHRRLARRVGLRPDRRMHGSHRSRLRR